MFCDIHVFALLNFVISATFAQLQPQERGNDDYSYGYRTGSNFESAALCSEAGNCTCLFKKPHVIVKCTSAGDKLKEVAKDLPKTTTHL